MTIPSYPTTGFSEGFLTKLQPVRVTQWEYVSMGISHTLLRPPFRKALLCTFPLIPLLCISREFHLTLKGGVAACRLVGWEGGTEPICLFPPPPPPKLSKEFSPLSPVNPVFGWLSCLQSFSYHFLYFFCVCEGEKEMKYF